MFRARGAGVGAGVCAGVGAASSEEEGGSAGGGLPAAAAFEARGGGLNHVGGLCGWTDASVERFDALHHLRDLRVEGDALGVGLASVVQRMGVEGLAHRADERAEVRELLGVVAVLPGDVSLAKGDGRRAIHALDGSLHGLVAAHRGALRPGVVVASLVGGPMSGRAPRRGRATPRRIPRARKLPPPRSP